ncbi:MAG: hypothetical protein UY48_C0011G0020 [Candidatus Gottesmanbacteria bacterium GW2011_GWB1_49_7]|uniref:Uncharacterized protein n=1 Tax=Candidatus Gottesmanbacteria bacterium GW2011_GWB1_49_7 TaxID=1618448 RepID=A0A0G1W1G6_9BACT|nr:MAG: hypothetical protein UY48_C0011G0020 [Candidatus Gottesmanbacteria bacterium GW2011_GWB1_49_7]
MKITIEIPPGEREINMVAPIITEVKHCKECSGDGTKLCYEKNHVGFTGKEICKACNGTGHIVTHKEG